MFRRRDFLLSVIAIPAATSRAKADTPPPSNAEIPALLADTVGTRHASTGIVVVMRDAKEWRLITYGRSDAPDGRPLDGDTVFDIGSVTKLFTALLLADMVVRGEMAMDDPIGKYLPASVHMPTYHGQTITLADVVTYAPGLPGWPENIPPLAAEKPFPDYTVEQLYDALNGRKMDYAPGTHYVYSNFGFGLLGVALARRAGMGFEELVVSRICAPLGMDSTRITSTPSMQARVAPGHDQQLHKIASWTIPPALAGAGAFRSTANDMRRFLEAFMGLKRTSLTPAMARMLDIRRPADEPGLSAGAGWFVSTGHDAELVWKDGAVAGYSTFIGYSARNPLGTVILANGECGNILTPLGKHLLNADFPLAAK